MRQRREARVVAADCFVNVDTVRYSVPHKLIREHVEVLVAEEDVRIFHGGCVVATHRRSMEPHSRIVAPQHFEGLVRAEAAPLPMASPLEAMGRRLADYAAVIGGDA